MKTIEFETDDNPISIIANKIQGCKGHETDMNKTYVIMDRMTDAVDEYFVVNEPYRQVLIKIINHQE